MSFSSDETSIFSQAAMSKMGSTFVRRDIPRGCAVCSKETEINSSTRKLQNVTVMLTEAVTL